MGDKRTSTKRAPIVAARAAPSVPKARRANDGAHAPLEGVVEGFIDGSRSLFSNVCCFDRLHPKGSGATGMKSFPLPRTRQYSAKRAIAGNIPILDPLRRFRPIPFRERGLKPPRPREQSCDRECPNEVPPDCRRCAPAFGAADRELAANPRALPRPDCQRIKQTISIALRRLTGLQLARDKTLSLACNLEPARNVLQATPDPADRHHSRHPSHPRRGDLCGS